MSWFNKQYDVSMIRTTSKDALKRSALFVCGGDIAEADKLYNYFAKDMADIPAYDPPMESGFDKFKGEAVGFLQWIDANQDKLLNYVSIFQTLKAGGTVTPPTGVADVPPLP